MTHACSSSICEVPLGEIEEEKESFFEEKFWFFIIPSAILIGIAIFVEFVLEEVIISQILAFTSIMFSSPGVVLEAIEDLKNKRISANILMVIAAIASFFILHGQEGAMAILLYSIAEKLEEITADKSRNAIKDLLELAPDEALLKTEKGYKSVLSKDVKIGEIVGIKPGMKVPLDGRIIKGSSYFNESAITGESIPVYKKEGDEIFAASLNSDSFIDMTVLKESTNTLVAQIADSVRTAQLNRSKQEKFIEKFAKYYTPVILALSLTVMIVPQFFFHNFYDWFYRGLVLLVVSCPCALTLSTPLANIASLTKLAREGILVKGNRFIEKVKEIEVFAFDKTGTLTEGKLKIFDIVPYNGLEKSELLKIAGSLESLSEHPIGKAITNQTSTLEISFYPVNNFEIAKGKGIQGEIEGKTYRIGNQAYLEEFGVDLPIKDLEEVEQLGTIPILLALDTKFIGFITIRDVLRVTAPIIIEGLKKRGFKTVLISGDNQLVCNTIGSCLDIDESLGERLPNQKSEEIKDLKKKYKGVAMVGDGINDAPALALSDLGIAIGASATDITVETADVIIINDDLKKILTFVDIAKKTNKKIKQNIWTSISIKLTFAFLTVIGLMTLWLAVGIGDMGVSLLVLANGMTIFRYKFLYKQMPIEEIESQATSLICSHCKTKDIIPQHHGRDMILKGDKLVCWKNILKSEELETCDEEILLNCPYCKNQLDVQ
ncbi:MAG: cation-translocating P-type ATPase [Candidatus Lokiarchaeota archaeon]|nr:cation-translocating P-type ATPase [Candidatus Lokiarchaeota archaeon]